MSSGIFRKNNEKKFFVKNREKTNLPSETCIQLPPFNPTFPKSRIPRGCHVHKGGGYECAQTRLRFLYVPIYTHHCRFSPYPPLWFEDLAGERERERERTQTGGTVTHYAVMWGHVADADVSTREQFVHSIIFINLVPIDTVIWDILKCGCALHLLRIFTNN